MKGPAVLLLVRFCVSQQNNKPSGLSVTRSAICSTDRII